MLEKVDRVLTSALVFGEPALDGFLRSLPLGLRGHPRLVGAFALMNATLKSRGIHRRVRDPLRELVGFRLVASAAEHVHEHARIHVGFKHLALGALAEQTSLLVVDGHTAHRASGPPMDLSKKNVNMGSVQLRCPIAGIDVREGRSGT